MATELATGYVSIIPSTKGLGKTLTADVTKASDEAGDKGGKTLGEKLAKGFKIAGLAAAGFAATIAGIVIKGGISRQLNIEEAQAKLRGLGHDATSVQAIMTDALAAVKGTAYGLDTAATVAASAVAAGIKPGKDLEGYLRLTADAATIAGVSMGEMGDIINKVTAKGKAQMENINQLTERGIPIMGWLADSYGVTGEAMSKMVSQGKVDAETFRKVLEENLGGAALSSGNTTKGAFANMNAAMSRFGVTLTSWFFPLIKNVFNGITTIFDGANDLIKPFFEQLTDSFQKRAGPAIDAFPAKVLGAFTKVKTTMADLRRAFDLSDIYKNLGGQAAGVGQELASITEASPLIANLVKLRDRALPIIESIKTTKATLREAFDLQDIYQQMGGQAAGVGQQLAALTDASPLVAALVGWRGKIRTGMSGLKDEITTGWEAMTTAFKQGGNELTTSGLAGIMQTIGMMGHALWSALGPALSQLGPQILQLSQAFSPLHYIFAALQPIMPQVAQALTALAGALGGVLATVLPLVVNLMGQFTQMLSGAIATVLPTIIQLVTLFASAWAAVAPPLMQVAQVVASTVAGALGQIMPLVAGLVTDLVSGLVPILPPLARLFAQVAGVVAQLVPPIAQLATTYLAAVVQAFTLLVNAVLPLLPVIVQLASQLIAGLAPILPVIVQAVVQLAQVILSVWLGAIQQILPVIVELVGTLITGLIPILPPLVEAIALVASTLAGALGQALTAIIPVFVTLISDILSALLPMLPAITDLLVMLAQVFVQLITSAAPILPLLANLISQVVTALTPALPPLMNLLTLVVGVFVQLLGAITPILPVIMQLVTNCLGALMAIIKPLMPVITSLATLIGGALSIAFQAVQPVVTAFGNVLTWLIDNVVAPVVEAFVGIQETVSTVFQSLAGIVKGPINAVIRVVNKAIGGLNSISVSIPDWVPFLGGKTFALNIPTIPMLAKGGVVLPQAGGAVVGVAEAGEAEAVLPLSKLEAMLNQAPPEPPSRALTVNYYAAENRSISSREDLFAALTGARAMASGRAYA